ncbi:hypothetical protein HJG60_008455 [Phyllostomus discolor]|uniref:Uncharacterized protein n=1 Tax=Phyllostomus discolor TaxID=89673 RepID=A0A834DJR2_9CHIR|nr:hypothetical protein HJG60_008455 [Phyllostomus discolor]
MGLAWASLLQLMVLHHQQSIELKLTLAYMDSRFNDRGRILKVAVLIPEALPRMRGPRAAAESARPSAGARTLRPQPAAVPALGLQRGPCSAGCVNLRPETGCGRGSYFRRKEVTTGARDYHEALGDRERSEAVEPPSGG